MLINPSSVWHHDRCGRRLKLFIYLKDVDIHTHPTMVARKSQDTFYYNHLSNWAYHSRFDDSYVRSRHEVRSMVAPAGGGFLFDTNALHRSTLAGNRERDCLVLEFTAHNKIGHFMLNDNPCPGNKAGPPNSSCWPNSYPGLPLYPREVLNAESLVNCAHMY